MAKVLKERYFPDEMKAQNIILFRCCFLNQGAINKL